MWISLCSDRQNQFNKSNKIEDYKQWVSDHLLKAADLALCPKVVALFEDVNELLEKVKIKLSVQEGKL